MPTLTGSIELNRCNNTALRKASRRLSQVYDEILEPSGLKATQLSILAEIDRRGDEPPTMKTLAEALVMDRSTLGQNIRPLERDGLLALTDNPTDGRSKNVVLTKDGKGKVVEAEAMWRMAQDLFEKNFGVGEAAALRKALLLIATDTLPARASQDSLPYSK
jgi:DNA-binding MarR family transcriptional regulator